MNQLDRAILQRKADCEQRGTLSMEQVDRVFELLESVKEMDPPAFAALLYALCVLADIRARKDVMYKLDEARRLLESGWKDPDDPEQSLCGR